MMARRVQAVGPSATTVTADVPERQVLIGMEEEAEIVWQLLLLQRLDGARWITCDPHLTVQVDDLSGEQVVQLARAGEFPAVGRPFLALPLLDDATLASVRAQGVTLAQIEATCEFTATSQAVEGGGLTSVSHGPAARA